jgi:hypothetical protein
MSITLNPAPALWATDATISTGPQAGATPRLDPGVGVFAQGWTPGTLIAARHMNFLLGEMTDSLADIVSKVSNKALDGAGGGSYTPTAPINFLGAQSVNFHTASVDSTGTFTVTPGGKIDVISGASVEFNAPGDLKIDSVIGFFRLTLTPSSIEDNSGGTDFAWKARVVSGATCGWYQADVNAAFAIAFPINLNPGDDILTVTAAVDGSMAGVEHAAMPTGGDRVVLSLVRVSGTGAATVLATRADQSVDVAAYNAQHTIVLANGALDSGALPHTVDQDFAYYAVVHGATGANAEPGKFAVMSLSGQCVARSYRTSLITL